MSEHIIKTENLRVIYNKGKANEVRSLINVNIKIYPQEYVIMFGPSGCGKSTLLYAISGLQAPTEGKVEVEDRELSKMKKSELVEMHQKGIGMVFQAFYLIPSLNVIDNVCLPKVFTGEDIKARRERGMKLLERFGIQEQAYKFPSQLSGGQKQRVSIARALINEPQIILADEPVGNLDSESAENVLKILKELNEIDKKTVILVTHNAEHLHFADRVIHMKDGQVTSEEVNKDKRPKEVIAEEIKEEGLDETSNELKLLMRTFKNLSPQQIGSLLVPFKANQLLSYVLNELSEEQVNAAGSFLKELLFENIDFEKLEGSLDLSLEKGGAGWNSLRVRSFAKRVKAILSQVENIKKMSKEEASVAIAEHLTATFKVDISENVKIRLAEFLRLRLENRLDRIALEQRMDKAFSLGGLGLYKGTAEKFSREMEMIMLLNYTA